MSGNATSRTLFVAVFAFAAGAAVYASAVDYFFGNSSQPAVTATKINPDDPHGNPADTHESENIVRLSETGAKTIGVGIAAVALRPLSQSLTVPGNVELSPERIAKVTPPVGGKIVRVLVQRGDVVKKGQPILVLDSPEVSQAHAEVERMTTAIRQGEATLQTARAETKQARTRGENARKSLLIQHELASAGAFSQASLIAARTNLSDTETELATAQEEAKLHEVQFERARRLFEKGFIAESALDAARLERSQDASRVRRATARVEAARETLGREKRLATGGLLNRQATLSAEAETRAAEADISRAVRQEQAAQIALTGARQALASALLNLRTLEGANGHAEETGGGVTIFAPLSGVVSVQSATTGETVERSATLFQIEDLSRMIVEANVPEKDVAKVKIGLPVAVTVAAYPGERFTGVVQGLASSVDEKTRSLAIRCVVAKPSQHLRRGMFATVSLMIGEVHSVIAVPSSAIVTERSESGAETPVVFISGHEEREYEKRPVITGQPMGEWTEIRGGLKPGDKVAHLGAYFLLAELKKGKLGEEGHAH